MYTSLVYVHKPPTCTQAYDAFKTMQRHAQYIDVTIETKKQAKQAMTEAVEHVQ